MLEDDGGLAAWLESKRLLTSPERHIATLRCLLAEDDDALLMHNYDLLSDPQTVAILRAQQRAAGQRRRRLRRLATRREVTSADDINAPGRQRTGTATETPGTLSVMSTEQAARPSATRHASVFSDLEQGHDKSVARAYDHSVKGEPRYRVPPMARIR